MVTFFNAINDSPGFIISILSINIKGYLWGRIFIMSLISIISVNLFLNLEVKSNLVLLTTFCLLEADSQFYQETFDPILFIAIFTK